MNNNIYERLTKIEELLKIQTILKKEVLDMNETANYLKISKSHLYKLTSKKQIPHSCPNGKRIYFNREELDKWLQRNKVDAINSSTIDFDNCLRENPIDF
jgi:excisionase family DNA binding protein